MKLRDYQDRAIAAARTELSGRGSTLLVMPTGTGKTVVFARLAADAPGRSLILAHRSELLDQAGEKVLACGGGPIAVEKADSYANLDSLRPPRTVLAMVQSLHPERLTRFPRDAFSLVVVDEAHHAPAHTYRAILDHFRPAAKVLGVTATPKRHDDRAMGEVFESVAFEMGIRAAVDDGWLVPVHQQVVKVDGLDFSKARVKAGDFFKADLEKILSEEKILHKVAVPTVELAAGRPTILFCVNVAHAHALAEVIGRYCGRSVAALDGGTLDDLRDQTIERFKDGRLQFLCNVGLFLEGFDAPNCSCVAMARPTKSLALYTQALGRGTRPLPGVVDGLEGPLARRMAILNSGKPDVLILDYAGNAGRHKIVDAQDVLGGKYSDEVKQHARKTQEKEGRAVDVDEAMERAEVELALREEERQRRAQIKATAEYQTHEVSVFGGRQPRPSSTAEQPKRRGSDPASDRQVAYLVHLGVPLLKARSFSFAQAGVVISRLKQQRQGSPA